MQRRREIEREKKREEEWQRHFSRDGRSEEKWIRCPYGRKRKRKKGERGEE